MTSWLAVIVAAFALIVSLSVYRGQLFELARSLHADLTTGDVAAARDVLGPLTRAGAEERTGYEVGRVCDAWFKILWCFERVLAGRERIGGLPGLGRSARKYLDRQVAWHVQTLHDDMLGLREELDERLRESGNRNGLDDRDSCRALHKLARELQVGRTRECPACSESRAS